MTSPFLKNFGTAAEIATSVSKALIPGTEKGNPGGDGTFVGATLAAATPTRVEHSLGKQPSGWLVVDANAPVAPYRTAWDGTSITIQSATAATVTLWIF